MTPKKTRVLFATKNPGKLIEFKKAFDRLHSGYEVISFNELSYDIPDCEETGITFEENALLKVQNTRRHLTEADKNMIIIGDDSGMEIDSLNGKPGVFTRRWSGIEMSDEDIIDYCLNKMEGINNRSASYVSCFMVSTADGKSKTIVGENRGVILKQSKQSSMLKGMPFRSLFFVPELNLMFHEVRDLPTTKRRGYRIGHEEAIIEIVSYLNQ
jgi:XTP/dITP diphosphohydrolase